MNQLETINHAFLHRTPVEVWQHGELIGVGLITKHTKDDIVLNDGMHYLKRNCEFKINQ